MNKKELLSLDHSSYGGNAWDFLPSYFQLGRTGSDTIQQVFDA
jgi:hypothetical protein